VSRVVILVFGVLMGALGIALNHLEINLDYLYRLMGILIGSAVFPVAFSITWGRASGLGAISGALGGLILGLCSWLGYASTLPGGVNIENTGNTSVMLAGNVMSMLSSAVISTLVSLIRPDDCDWSATKSIALVDEDANAALTPDDEAAIDRAMKMISAWGIGLALVLVVAWPLLTLPAGVFSKGYFTFWVILSIIWGLMATLAMVLLPVWESRSTILAVLSCGSITLTPVGKVIDESAEEEVEEGASEVEE